MCGVQYTLWFLIQIPILVYFVFSTYIVCVFHSHVFSLFLACIQFIIYMFIPLPHESEQPNIMCCLLTIVLFSQLMHIIYGIIITCMDLTNINNTSQKQQHKRVILGYVLYCICYYIWIIFVVNVSYVQNKSSHSLLTKVRTIQFCKRLYIKKPPCCRTRVDISPNKNPIITV